MGFCFLLALLLCSVPVRAAPEIDQVCQPQIWGGYSIAVSGPIGQEFFPSMPSLTFVDLWINNGTSSADDSTRVFVVIRADSIGGVELGSSHDVFIPKPFYDAIRLTFPTPIGLETGRTHVIEARVEGPGNPLLGAGTWRVRVPESVESSSGTRSPTVRTSGSGLAETSPPPRRSCGAAGRPCSDDMLRRHGTTGARLSSDRMRQRQDSVDDGVQHEIAGVVGAQAGVEVRRDRLVHLGGQEVGEQHVGRAPAQLRDLGQRGAG